MKRMTYPEIEFACAKDPHKHAALYQALRRVSGVLAYRQHMPGADLPYVLAAIVIDTRNKAVLLEQIERLAKEHEVEIDIKHMVTGAFVDSIFTRRLEFLVS